MAKTNYTPEEMEEAVRLARHYDNSDNYADWDSPAKFARALLQRDTEAKAAEQERDAWKREATSWESEVVEFGHPITPDHAHHEVRDWLNDAYAAGRAAAEGEVERAQAEAATVRRHYLHEKACKEAANCEVASLRLRNQELVAALERLVKAVGCADPDCCEAAIEQNDAREAARAALQPRSEETR